jgi:hypothetical protein
MLSEEKFLSVKVLEKGKIHITEQVTSEQLCSQGTCAAKVN